MPRQRIKTKDEEIIRLAHEGAPRSVIAAALGVSVATVGRRVRELRVDGRLAKHVCCAACGRRMPKERTVSCVT